MLFRTLATLRTDIALFDDVDQLRWNGPTPAFDSLAARLDAASTENGGQRPVRRRPSRASDPQHVDNASLRVGDLFDWPESD